MKAVMVLWLFFDLGSTLIDEGRAEARYEKDVHDLLLKYGAGLDWWEYIRSRDTLVMKRVASGHRQLAAELFIEWAKGGSLKQFLRDLDTLCTFECYSGLWSLYEDAVPALRELSPSYHCGLIANQDSRVRGFLEEKFALTQYFKTMAISGELGYAKPDLRIFIHALQAAGVKPEDAAMVGDRVDTDIAPANILRMATIRVRRDSIFSRLEPRDDWERPMFEVKDLREIAKLPLRGL